MALDMELAEYFKERSQIEETYAKSLAKASKRLYLMDPGVLGYVIVGGMACRSDVEYADMIGILRPFGNYCSKNSTR